MNGLIWRNTIRMSLALAVAVAAKGDIEFSGRLNDSANGALVGSDLTAASFTDDFAIANNVALYALSLSGPDTYEFVSHGFAMGGVDPYFTLFRGTGPASTFVGSNYDQAFLGGGGDFTLDLSLAAGDYVVAIGAFANMSFAENLGSGTLGDGFISLGEPGALGNYFYDVTIRSGAPTAVPEPATVFLLAVPVSLLLFRPRRATGSRCELLGAPHSANPEILRKASGLQ